MIFIEKLLQAMTTVLARARAASYVQAAVEAVERAEKAAENALARTKKEQVVQDYLEALEPQFKPFPNGSHRSDHWYRFNELVCGTRHRGSHNVVDVPRKKAGRPALGRPDSLSRKRAPVELCTKVGCLCGRKYSYDAMERHALYRDEIPKKTVRNEGYEIGLVIKYDVCHGWVKGVFGRR
jgi:hypothetical protein